MGGQGPAGPDATGTRAGGPVTELLLVRHGVTIWNRERRFQGQIDTPLSDQGLAQAKRLAARLRGQPVAAVYASDLARARQTAEPIAQALGLPLQVDPGLRERAYGRFEGMTWDDIARELPEAFARWRAREPDFEIPGGGETLVALTRRVAAVLDGAVQRHRGERVVMVTHGGVLDSMYRIASGLPLQAPRNHELLNASLNTIGWDGGRFAVHAWADVSHLDDSADDPQVSGR
jgi:probable phosphoglycerate mutase